MDSNASFSKIIELLTTIGNAHVDIVDTFRFNSLELSGALKKGLNATVMLLDAIEVQPDGSEKVSAHRNQCAITILGKKDVSTARIDNHDAQNEVIDHCQAIAFEVAARLLYEASFVEKKWLYGNITKNSFSYYKVGPVFTDSLYGYRCEFPLKSIENYTIDKEKWIDIN